ncbi:MAG TPA: hypothetical protein VMU81_00285 [Acetobacteraceae bacterium]|jgi:hypothetical protein|nr:hypothetical protein [Acetobacteraceae bacterium]
MTQKSRHFAPYADATELRQRILEHISTLRNHCNLPLLASLAFMRAEAAFNAFLDAPSYTHLTDLMVIEADMRRISATLNRLPPAAGPSGVPDTLRRGLPASARTTNLAPGLRIANQPRSRLGPYAGWWSTLPRV